MADVADRNAEVAGEFSSDLGVNKLALTVNNPGENFPVRPEPARQSRNALTAFQKPNLDLRSRQCHSSLVLSARSCSYESEHMLSHLAMSTPNFKKAQKRGQAPTPVDPRSLGGKVRAARNKMGLSTRALGAKVGVSNVTITHIETGQTNPDRTTLIRLAQELRSDFGRADLRQYVKASVLRQVPVLAYVAGGRPIVHDIHDQSVIVDPDLIRLTNETCGLKVKGSSMEADHILDGDILICRKTDPANVPRNKIVVVDLKGDRGATVKRWEVKGEVIYLSAKNDSEEVETMTFKNWEYGKVYEIVGLIRPFK